MKKIEFQEKLYELFETEIDDVSIKEKCDFIQKIFIEYQINKDKVRSPLNKGNKWKDEELKLILSVAATKENCLKFARLFDRGMEALSKYTGGLVHLRISYLKKEKVMLLSNKFSK